MIVTVVGLGFSKKFNVKAGSTLEQLAEKINVDMPSINTFYYKGEPMEMDTELEEGMEITAMAKEQKIDLGVTAKKASTKKAAPAKK
jgi:hypothetical protein